MHCRNIAAFICIFVAVVIATVHNDSQSGAGEGSGPEVTVYPLTTENLGSSTREPEQQITETAAVDLGALLDAGDGAVITLVAGDTRLAAHRAVLMDRSPVFAASLQHMPPEASGGQVVIPDVEGAVLRQLLSYMYTLQAPQLSSMALQLLAAADTYGLSSLKAHCEQQAAAQLSVETAAATAAVAVRHSSATLRQAAISFIRADLLHVMDSQGWRDAMKSQLDVMMKVLRLLSDAPLEASVPATAANGTTPTTQQHSDHSRHGSSTPASVPQPATSNSTFPSDDAVSRFVPATAANGTTPPTQQHSDHSGHGGSPPASVAQPTTSNSTFPSDDAVSRFTPAPAASGAASDTKPDGDHRCRTPASAAPTTAAPHTPTCNYTAYCPLWCLSAWMKNWKLIQAAKAGAAEEVKVLLAAGADVDTRDKEKDENFTALHWAAIGGHVEVARHLLAAGADVDARNSRQTTPLILAVWNRRKAMVRLLLEASADPNSRNRDGRTALHAAAYHADPEMVGLLLRAGADKGATDIDGYTPLDFAKQLHHRHIFFLLE